MCNRVMMTPQDRNKKNVVAFYDLMFNQAKPQAAMQRYGGDDYIQHNPHVATGKQGFVDYFERMAAAYPHKKVTFKRVFADGNYVVLHCHQEWGGREDYACMDIFRLDERGKILEHWDVIQPMPTASQNDNGMF